MNSLINAFGRAPMSTKVLVAVYILAAIVLAFVLPAGEAKAQSGNVYGNSQGQVYSVTEEAVVLQVMRKTVEPRWETRAAGASIGALIGGAITAKAGGSNHYAANLLGATVGGLFGDRVANSTMADEAQEIVLRMGTSVPGQPARIITIVQPAPFDPVIAGDAVYLIQTGGKFRVVRRMQQVVLQ